MKGLGRKRIAGLPAPLVLGVAGLLLAVLVIRRRQAPAAQPDQNVQSSQPQASYSIPTGTGPDLGGGLVFPNPGYPLPTQPGDTGPLPPPPPPPPVAPPPGTTFTGGSSQDYSSGSSDVGYIGTPNQPVEPPPPSEPPPPEAAPADVPSAVDTGLRYEVGVPAWVPPDVAATLPVGGHPLGV